MWNFSWLRRRNYFKLPNEIDFIKLQHKTSEKFGFFFEFVCIFSDEVTLLKIEIDIKPKCSRDGCDLKKISVFSFFFDFLLKKNCCFPICVLFQTRAADFALPRPLQLIEIHFKLASFQFQNCKSIRVYNVYSILFYMFILISCLLDFLLWLLCKFAACLKYVWRIFFYSSYS